MVKYGNNETHGFMGTTQSASGREPSATEPSQMWPSETAPGREPSSAEPGQAQPSELSMWEQSALVPSDLALLSWALYQELIVHDRVWHNYVKAFALPGTGNIGCDYVDHLLVEVAEQRLEHVRI